MIFTSPMFLFIFLPVLYVAYRLIKNDRWKNVLLCTASIIFYAFGEIRYLPLLLASALINFLFGKCLRNKKSKAVFILAVIFNVAFLGTFKLLPVKYPSLILPLGISFYTFQGLSYVIDVYRDPHIASDDFLNVFLYISFFPRLLAGPIERYKEFSQQIISHDVSEDKTEEGIERFIFGFSKKMLIAVPCSKIAEAAFTSPALSSPFAWLGAAAFMLEIYYDFSGLSDMAIGIGKMFGFDFHENFNFPYAAASLKEFWRRWHISLSTWFKEYVYIPLGGSREGKLKTAANKMLVFLLTGLWHGVNPTYLLWGLGNGALACAEDFIPLKKIEKSLLGRIVGRIYTLFAVCILFVLFRSESVFAFIRYISSMFSFSGKLGYDTLGILSPAAVLSMLLGAALAFKSFNIGLNAKRAVSIILFVLCIMAMANGDFTPFIYMQF